MVWKLVVFRAEMTFKYSSVLQVGLEVEQIMDGVVHLLTVSAYRCGLLSVRLMCNISDKTKYEIMA